MARQCDIPGDRRYAEGHMWIKQEGGVHAVGITDYAQAQLGQAVFVELPPAGARFAAGAEFGSIESAKAASPLLMPVDGEVVEANAALADDPALVNSGCYGKGWLIKIKPSDAAEAGRLMDAGAYRASLA